MWNQLFHNFKKPQFSPEYIGTAGHSKGQFPKSGSYRIGQSEGEIFSPPFFLGFNLCKLKFFPQKLDKFFQKKWNFGQSLRRHEAIFPFFPTYPLNKIYFQCMKIFFVLFQFNFPCESYHTKFLEAELTQSCCSGICQPGVRCLPDALEEEDSDVEER